MTNYTLSQRHHADDDLVMSVKCQQLAIRNY